MISVSLLISVVALALIASPHCASMCACGFAQGLVRNRQSVQGFLIGRSASYVVMGVLLGYGSSLLESLPSMGLPIFSAFMWMLHAMLLFMALVMIFSSDSLSLGFVQRIALPESVARRLGDNTPKHFNFSRSFKAGSMWFLMPCAALYGAYTLAYLSGSALQGGILMAVYAGLTSPVLMATSRFRAYVQFRWGEAAMYRISGLAILGGLVLMTVRHLGLISVPAVMQGTGLCL